MSAPFSGPAHDLATYRAHHREPSPFRCGRCRCPVCLTVQPEGAPRPPDPLGPPPVRTPVKRITP
jgi:hypothetical protein